MGYDCYTNRPKEYVRIVGKLAKPEVDTTRLTTDLATMMRNGVPDPDWLIGQVLYEEQSHLVFGAPSSGKSWLALHWAAVVIRRKQHVLYLDEENRARRTVYRLNALGVDPDLVEEYFHYVDGPGFTLDDESYGRLQTLVKEYDPTLVVFDTMISFLSLIGLSENDSTDVSGWFGRFVDPLTRQGRTAVVLDHTGHEGTHPRGSSAKVGKPDVVIRCKVVEPFDMNKAGKVRLSIYENKDREGMFPATGVYYAIGGDGKGRTTIRYLPTSETDALEVNANKAMAALRRMDQPAGYNAWYKQSGIPSKKQFDSARQLLIERQAVRKVTGGYEIIE